MAFVLCYANRAGKQRLVFAILDKKALFLSEEGFLLTVKKIMIISRTEVKIIKKMIYDYYFIYHVVCSVFAQKLLCSFLWNGKECQGFIIEADYKQKKGVVVGYDATLKRWHVKQKKS